MTTRSAVYPEVDVLTAHKSSTDGRSPGETIEAAAPKMKAKLPFLDFVGGPLLPRAFRKMLTALPSLAKLASWRPQAALPALALASLRVVRARRTRDR